MKLHPNSRKYFGFTVDGETYYQFTCVPKGWSYAPYLASEYFKPARNQINAEDERSKRNKSGDWFYDESLGCYSSEDICRGGHEASLKFLEQHGLTINKKKCVAPTQNLEWLGMNLNDGLIKLTKKTSDYFTDQWKILCRVNVNP